MQTFLPYSDFVECARVLDRARLGKQRVETLQILRTLAGKSSGWTNHPAVKMWRNYEDSLIDYGIAICDEWIARGYADTCRGKIISLATEFSPMCWSTPLWLGSEKLHASHRSNLLRKSPEHYRQYWPNDPDDLDYYWPVE